ncbi:MAG TPA: ABC transporter ATP-binding protein [Acidimicrobiia bacterium]|jgi:putative ABC transport system ATP-binding protein|nr:ABC transporter ATP-binding protein [Acidimicrobiia bacterium]
MTDQARLLEARGLVRVYDTGPEPVVAVNDFSLTLDRGAFVVIRGRSGSGKTTLLNMLGGLDQPTSGRVRIEGEDLSTLDEHSRAELRRNKIGFIFQAFGLIPILSAVENVEIPLRMVGAEPSHRRDRSRQLLERVGLADRASHFPEELSGGEQQRVAIARALANDPILLIADEPTGQLDSRTGQSIVGLIRALVHDQNIAAVAATHDPALLAIADRVIELRDGEMVSDVLARAL